MAGITGNGTILAIGSITSVVNLTSVGNESSCEAIDITSMNDTNATYLPGIPDSGEVTFEGNYDKTVYNALEAIRVAASVTTATLTFSDGSDISLGSCFITRLGTSASKNGPVTFSGTIKLTGAQTHSTT
jgi:hypothetical protein